VLFIRIPSNQYLHQCLVLDTVQDTLFSRAYKVCCAGGAISGVAEYMYLRMRLQSKVLITTCVGEGHALQSCAMGSGIHTEVL